MPPIRLRTQPRMPLFSFLMPLCPWGVPRPFHSNNVNLAISSNKRQLGNRQNHLLFDAPTGTQQRSTVPRRDGAVGA
jgi:hypothetical protein